MQKLCLILVVILLAACGTSRDEAPQPQPPTAPEQINVATLPPPAPVVVTRTPRPSAAPTITATVSEALLPYTGAWTLFLRYELRGSFPVQTAIYSASAELSVATDGAVVGFGKFSASFQSPDCVVEALESETLNFRLTGNLAVTETGTPVTLNLIPSETNLPEAYRIACADPLDVTQQEVTEWNQDLLFPILEASQQTQINLTMNGYSARPAPQILDLAAPLTGQLTTEIYLSR